MQLVIGGKPWTLPDGASEAEIKQIYDHIMSGADTPKVVEPIQGPIANSTADFKSVQDLTHPIDIKYGSPADMKFTTVTQGNIDSVIKNDFGAQPNMFTLPEKVNMIQNRQQGLHDQAKEQSFGDAMNVFAGQETTKLGIGAKGIFTDNKNDLSEFEHERNLLSPLGEMRPGAKLAGTVLPYAALGIGQGWALEGASKLGSIPAVMSKYRAARNLSPQLFAGGEALAENPIAQNALFGAIIGAVDPYDTAASGAANSAASTWLLGKVFSKAERYQDFNTSPNNDVIDWARKKGYYVSSGIASGNKDIQMEEHALSNFKDTIGIAQNIEQKNNKTTARVILNDIFGVNGDELNSKTLGVVQQKASSDIADSLKGVYGNSQMFLQGVDDTLGKALGQRPHGSNLKLTDNAEWTRYGRLYDEIQEIVGKSYITGDKYQKIERLLREERNLAGQRGYNELPKLIDDIDKHLDDSIISTMNQNAAATGRGASGSEMIDAYNAAKQKYAVAQMIQRHTDQGEINWGGLHEEMRSFNPSRYALHNASEGSPIGELQNLLAFHRLNLKPAGLGTTQEMSKTISKDAGELSKLKIDMRLRGVDPKLYAPFGFRNAQRIAGGIGSSNSDTGGYDNLVIDSSKNMFDMITNENSIPRSHLLDKMEGLLRIGYRP